jgi:hypothetical protein
MWRGRFAWAQSLPEKCGYTKWPCLECVSLHLKKKKTIKTVEAQAIVKGKRMIRNWRSSKTQKFPQ